MAKEHVYKRTLVRKTISSAALEQDREITVYLPPGYNELLTYPVIYCQDGLEFFNFGRIATTANEQILDYGMEPVIIVGVHVDLERRSADYSPNGSRFPAYRTFFTEEMLPWVESNYPIRREAASRVLAGDSLGGTVSLHLALERPDLFRNVLSLSGAFFGSTREKLNEKNDLSALSIYMLIGLQETDVKTEWGTIDFLTYNREAKTLLERKNAALRYIERDGKHTWGFWQQELPSALRYFFP